MTISIVIRTIVIISNILILITPNLYRLEQGGCILSLKNYYNINCRFDKVCIDLQFIDISIFLQGSNNFFLVNTLEKYAYKLYN